MQMFLFLTGWSVFKNKTCSLSNVKFVDASKLVIGPFKNQTNLVSTVTGPLFLPAFVFPVTTDQ